MRKLVFLLLVAFAALGHARSYDRADLEALLAPVALYPDSLVTHILIAASYPDQVAEAARGAPAAPHWHPSVSALVPYPEILRRMAESPQWMHDLAEAHVGQQAQVMATLAELRSRANAYGGQVPAPSVQTQTVYVYRYGPSYWNPWPVVPFVHFHSPHVHRHVPRFHHHRRDVHVKPYHRVPEAHRRPIINSTPRLFDRPRSAPRERGGSSRGLFRRSR